MQGRFLVDYLELSSNQHFAILFFRPFSCLEDIVILNTIEEFRCISQDQNNSSTRQDQKMGKSYDLTINTFIEMHLYKTCLQMKGSICSNNQIFLCKLFVSVMSRLH